MKNRLLVVGIILLLLLTCCGQLANDALSQMQSSSQEIDISAPQLPIPVSTDFYGMSFNPYGGSLGSSLLVNIRFDKRGAMTAEAEASMMEFDSFEFLARIPYITTLTLYGGKVNSFEGLEDLTSLTVLQFSGSDLEGKSLPKLDGLRFVVLEDCQVDTGTFLHNYPPELPVIRLENVFQTAGDEGQIVLAWELGDNAGQIEGRAVINELNFKFPVELAALPELHGLEVRRCNLTDYAPLLENQLSRVKFSDCEIEDFRAFAYPVALINLEFENCSFQSLAGLEEMENLRELSFSGCTLARGISLPDALAGVPSLSNIYLDVPFYDLLPDAMLDDWGPGAVKIR